MLDLLPKVAPFQIYDLGNGYWVFRTSALWPLPGWMTAACCLPAISLLCVSGRQDTRVSGLNSIPQNKLDPVCMGPVGVPSLLAV